MKKSVPAALFVLIVLLLAFKLGPERWVQRGASSAVENAELSAELLVVPGAEPAPGEVRDLDQERAILSTAAAPEVEETPDAPALEIEPATGTLRVLVREIRTGRPASGVPVELTDFTILQSGATWDCLRHVLSDDEGVAEFTDVSPGRVYADVLAAVEEGQDSGQEVTISAGVTSTLTIAVSPAKPVVGMVEDAAGRRVAGAKIWRMSQGFRGVVVGESAGDGSFELPYQRPWQHLVASHPGYASSPPVVVRDVHVEGGDDSGGALAASPITLTLSPQRGRVFGRVLDPDGEPASGVQMMLSQFEGRKDPRVQTGRSELDGTFDFPDAIVGITILDARVAHGALTQEQFVVTNGGSHELVVQLRAGGTLQGSVTTPGGAPWRGAMISADRINFSALGQTDVVVGADGTFVLRGQGPGEVTYRIMDTEWNEIAVETLVLLDGEVTEWHPVCAPRSPLHGYVRMEAGPPLTDWQVQAQPMRGPDAYLSWRGGSRTDENGRFEVTPEAGETYRLRVFAPGASGPEFALEVTGVRIEDMPLDLAVPSEHVPTGVLSGRLVDHVGNPVAAGRISIVIGEKSKCCRRVTSEEDGSFEIRHVPAGPGQILDGALNSTKILKTVSTVAPGSIVDVGDVVMPR